MRLFVIARHGQSTLNVEERVNGDPSLEIALTERGEEEARRLGLELAHIPIDRCVCTRFPRTRQTAELALAGRSLVPEVEPLLDDVRVGELEGGTLAEYRAWKQGRARDEPFPGGESLNDAARRYAGALERLLGGGGTTVLVICHEIPLRYTVNAAAGSDVLDRPARSMANATPYLFSEDALARAAARIVELVGARPAVLDQRA
ncbi:MAG: histidine phosphatase family protein [Actinobacteria bacterium]|nr:histidine phosphatase family protein [Actinomycetota bacterium]